MMRPLYDHYCKYNPMFITPMLNLKYLIFTLMYQHHEHVAPYSYADFQMVDIYMKSKETINYYAFQLFLQ